MKELSGAVPQGRGELRAKPRKTRTRRRRSSGTHANRYPIPRTVSTRSAPSFFRSVRTYTSTMLDPGSKS
ncbi:hypothetical protein GCM10023097_38410 [Streptomyces collinus]